MSIFHFYLILFSGILAVAISLNKIKPLATYVEPLSKNIKKLIGFLGWNLIVFALYDRLIISQIG